MLPTVRLRSNCLSVTGCDSKATEVLSAVAWMGNMWVLPWASAIFLKEKKGVATIMQIMKDKGPWTTVEIGTSKVKIRPTFNL